MLYCVCPHIIQLQYPNLVLCPVPCFISCSFIQYLYTIMLKFHLPSCAIATFAPVVWLSYFTLSSSIWKSELIEKLLRYLRTPYIYSIIWSINSIFFLFASNRFHVNQHKFSNGEGTAQKSSVEWKISIQFKSHFPSICLPPFFLFCSSSQEKYLQLGSLGRKRRSVMKICFNLWAFAVGNPQ